MKQHDTRLLSEVHPKPVAAHLRPVRSPEAKPDPKPVGIDWRKRQGQAFARAMTLAGMTPQETAFALGHRDQATVSKWASGVERVQWDRLCEIDALRPWIPAAWGRALGHQLQIAVTAVSA